MMNAGTTTNGEKPKNGRFAVPLTTSMVIVMQTTQGWCNADNEHDSEQTYGNAECWQGWHLKPRPELELVARPCFDKENLRDWGSAWSASMTAAMASHVARFERELEFLKQKIAHDDSIAGQSVSFVNDRASRGGELNTDDAKDIVIVCEYTHGHGELISPNLIMT